MASNSFIQIEQNGTVIHIFLLRPQGLKMEISLFVNETCPQDVEI